VVRQAKKSRGAKLSSVTKNEEGRPRSAKTKKLKWYN
jgi:hypothetical protein